MIQNNKKLPLVSLGQSAVISLISYKNILFKSGGERMNIDTDYRKEYLHKEDLAQIFGFGRDKINRFLASGILLVVKINKDYIITRTQLDKWFQQNAGKPINF